MKYDKAIALIKDFEKCRLKAYKDGGGVWTIGWGSTGEGITEGLVWTQELADKRFENHFGSVVWGIQKMLKVSTTENQFCALCSLVYNIGHGAFKESTLLRLINENKSDPEALADQFLRWDKDNGKQIPGLTRRREFERKLFLL